MGGGLFARGPVCIETASIGEVDIEPAVLVVIEERDAASLGLDDDALLVDSAPDVRECASPAFSATSINCTGEAGGPSHGGMHNATIPSPQRSGEDVKQAAAEHEAGKSREIVVEVYSSMIL